MSLHWPKIMLFGDSQVNRALDPENGFWGALLANRLQRKADVVTRGFSGYTSRSCFNVIHHVFNPENIKDVIGLVIFVGTNDASEKNEADGDNNQHVSIDEYSENLGDMIDYLQSIGLDKNKIILITPGPYVEEKFLKWCAEIGRVFPDRKNETIVKYVDACVKCSAKYGVEVINLYEEVMKQEDWPDYLLDGVHLSSKASHLLFEKLWPMIEKRVDMSTMILPYWRDIANLPKGCKEIPLYKKLED